MSWKEFLGEIEKACKEKKVAYEDLKRWIYDTIPYVEKDATAFLVSLGPTPESKKLLTEVHILTGKILHEFTVYEEKKEYNIYQPKTISAIHQTTENGYVKCIFLSGSTRFFRIEDNEKNLKSVTRFVQQIAKTWG